VSVSAYADLVKVLLIVVAIVLSISIFVKVSPLVLFSGVGAWLAVLMLIFKDTILSFLANIQISSQERIKDGDWIEVPSYQADGIVTDINLYSIKVQNWDKTFTVIPTFKMDEVAYKNWRGMIEEKGRRFIKSLVLDITSIKCCDMSLVEKLRSSPIVADLLKDILPELQERLSQKAAADGSTSESSLVTNLQLFIQYTEAYLQGRDDLQQRKRFLKFVTIKEITPAGLSIEILWFTKATGKAQYEATQTDVMLHLIAILALFDLRMYQHPSGLDLKTYVKERLGD
jgi:miniconductance mechanosensitive channel